MIPLAIENADRYVGGAYLVFLLLLLIYVAHRDGPYRQWLLRLAEELRPVAEQERVRAKKEQEARDKKLHDLFPVDNGIRGRGWNKAEESTTFGSCPRRKLLAATTSTPTRP